MDYIISKWMDACAQLAEMDRAEHADISDHYGRVWAWWKGEMYRHCAMAWPLEFILDRSHGLPNERVLNNPNYRLCATCLNGRERNISPCKHDCTHTTH